MLFVREEIRVFCEHPRQHSPAGVCWFGSAVEVTKSAKAAMAVGSHDHVIEQLNLEELPGAD
jgi:hypothetical protein